MSSILNTLERDDDASAVISWAQDLPGVRAGSALVESGGRLLVAQDDAYELFWLLDLEVGQVPRLESVSLTPGSGPLAKSHKPDFEAAADLPDGRIVVIGSGSAPTRNSVVIVDPDRGTYDLKDASRIYEIVGGALGHALNIEAMLWIGDGFRLFHRGNSGDGNATVDIVVDPDDPREVLVGGISYWDLGHVPGQNGPVALTFTDADLDLSGRQWFLAAAEDTPNAIDDGPIAGASLGFLSGDTGRWTLLRDADGAPSTRKAEGLVIAADTTGGWIVTDLDDEHASAELCRIELSGWDAAQ